MQKMAVVKGLGPNSVEIIGMVFSNFGNAFDFTKSVLGEPDSQGVEDGKSAAYWSVDFEGKGGETAQKFFTGYYGGCGECSGIVVMEIDAGVPLVEFDLD